MGTLVAMHYPRKLAFGAADHTYVMCGTGGEFGNSGEFGDRRNVSPEKTSRLSPIYQGETLTPRAHDWG
jgi:hypothetical protein